MLNFPILLLGVIVVSVFGFKTAPLDFATSASPYRTSELVRPGSIANKYTMTVQTDSVSTLVVKSSPAAPSSALVADGVVLGSDTLAYVHDDHSAVIHIIHKGVDTTVDTHLRESDESHVHLTAHNNSLVFASISEGLDTASDTPHAYTSFAYDVYNVDTTTGAATLVDSHTYATASTAVPATISPVSTKHSRPVALLTHKDSYAIAIATADGIHVSSGPRHVRVTGAATQMCTRVAAVSATKDREHPSLWVATFAATCNVNNMSNKELGEGLIVVKVWYSGSEVVDHYPSSLLAGHLHTDMNNDKNDSYGMMTHSNGVVSVVVRDSGVYTYVISEESKVHTKITELCKIDNTYKPAETSQFSVEQATLFNSDTLLLTATVASTVANGAVVGALLSVDLPSCEVTHGLGEVKPLLERDGISATVAYRYGHMGAMAAIGVLNSDNGDQIVTFGQDDGAIRKWNTCEAEATKCYTSLAPVVTEDQAVLNCETKFCDGDSWLDVCYGGAKVIVCPTGAYNIDNSCQIRPSYYRTTMDVMPRECPNGSYTTANGVPTGENATHCVICPAKHTCFYPSYPPMKCAHGGRFTAGVNGEYTELGSVGCLPCKAGHKCPGDATISECINQGNSYFYQPKEEQADCVPCGDAASRNYVHIRTSLKCDFCEHDRYLRENYCAPCAELEGADYCNTKTDVATEKNYNTMEHCPFNTWRPDSYSCVTCLADEICDNNGGKKWHYTSTFNLSTLSGKVNISITIIIVVLALVAGGVVGYIIYCRKHRVGYILTEMENE